jgi:hypothetical protein
MEWQPIETAPRDGAAILLRCPDAEHGALIAFWSDPTIGDTTEEEAGWYESECHSHRIFHEVTGWRYLFPPTE